MRKMTLLCALFAWWGVPDGFTQEILTLDKALKSLLKTVPSISPGTLVFEPEVFTT